MTCGEIRSAGFSLTGEVLGLLNISETIVACIGCDSRSLVSSCQ